MATSFRKYIESKVGNDFSQRFCDEVFTCSLPNLSAVPLTVPSSLGVGLESATRHPYIAVMRIDEDSNVWVANNETAAVPVGATFALSTSELIHGANPLVKYVVGGDILSFITDGTDVEISVAFYTLAGT